MESLPDALVQFILSQMCDARDVASCTCVSTRWKDSMPYLKSLCFPRNLTETLKSEGITDTVVKQMVARLPQLEELVVYCPFTSAGLAAWLSLTRSSLRHLDLRMDNLSVDQACADSILKLECIGIAVNLESLKLWGVLMIQSPKWDVFHRLQNLEIVGARLEDTTMNVVLHACPNLTHLSLLACEGLKAVTIELPQLKQCKLDFYGLGVSFLYVVSPKLELLEVQGCGGIRVPETQRLTSLSIASSSGTILWNKHRQ